MFSLNFVHFINIKQFLNKDFFFKTKTKMTACTQKI